MKTEIAFYSGEKPTITVELHDQDWLSVRFIKDSVLDEVQLYFFELSVAERLRDLLIEKLGAPEETEPPLPCELCLEDGRADSEIAIGITLEDDPEVGQRWVCEEHAEYPRQRQDPEEQYADAINDARSDD